MHYDRQLLYFDEINRISPDYLSIWLSRTRKAMAKTNCSSRISDLQNKDSFIELGLLGLLGFMA